MYHNFRYLFHKKHINQLKLDKKNNIQYLLIIILCFILYGNTIRNGYNLDDIFVAENNLSVQKGIKGIPEIFSSPYSEGENRTYGYRPIAKSTFAIEYSIFGENPQISHLINILLYTTICLLIFHFFKKIFADYSPWFSFIIVLIFAAHPIHTEVVASLKNREELLSFLSSILSLYFVFRSIQKKNWLNLIPALIFIIIGYLAKESALVFILIIPLFLYYFTTIKINKIVIVILITGIVLFIIRTIISNNISIDKPMYFFENPLYETKNLNSRILIGFSSLYEYLKLLIFPHPLLHYYGYNMIPYNEWISFRIIISIIFHISILIYALLNLKKKSILSFAILYYLISISMFSNFLVPVAGIIGERLIFTASLGFCIAIAFLSFKFLSEKNKKFEINYKIVVITLILIVPYSAKTISRNNDWEDNQTLFERDSKYLENSAKANVIYAGSLISEIRSPNSSLNNNVKNQKLAKATELYKQAIEIYPSYTNALKNLGNIYFTFYRDNKTAINYFKEALRSDSTNVEVLLNLGFIFENENDPKARICYNSAIKYEPNNVNALTLFANYSNKMGNLEKAIFYNEKIMQIDTLTDVPYINIGNYYLALNDTINAIKYWENAINKVPKNKNLCNLLSKYFKEKRDIEKSTYYQKLMNSI